MTKKILKVSLVGNTNAGKSTFINNTVGELISITNKKINTTKELVIGVKNINSIQYILYDTPGLNNFHIKNKSNNIKKAHLWQGIDQSNVILYFIDSKTFKFDQFDQFFKKLKKNDKEIIIVFNKIDLIDKKTLLPKAKLLNKEYAFNTIFFISAKFNTNTSDLFKYLNRFSINSSWVYNNKEISNKDEIFITNECTRSAILKFLHKEIPYKIKVVNKLFKYLKNGDIKIKQYLQIDDLRYKKIILGKNGEKIKSIREISQNQIKKILKSNIHLYLEIIKKNAK